MSKLLKFPEVPKKYLYEDYIAAHIQASGVFIERSLVNSDVDEILELDIVASDICEDKVDKTLIEIKSGGWGYPDLFKVKGWMTFLNINKGAFVVQESKKNQKTCCDIARDLNIIFIENPDMDKTLESLNPIIRNDPKFNCVNWIRYSFAMERAMVDRNKELKRSNPGVNSYRYLDNFYQAVTSRSFFKSDPLDRIHKLFKSYISYKNITAKMASELESGAYNDDCSEIPIASYKKTFYSAENNPLHFALYVEHLARLTIMKSCIDFLIGKKSLDHESTFVEHIQLMTLPKNIKEGLETVSKDAYFHRYPVFWQIFTYLFGGIIMCDYIEDDYKILSDLTGIPVEHIDDAFNAFNTLFPRENGWFMQFPNSNIKWHSLFPIPFSGIGVNFRRCEYSPDKTFDSMPLTQVNTIKDVIKWNKLAHDIASKNKELEIEELE